MASAVNRKAMRCYTDSLYRITFSYRQQNNDGVVWAGSNKYRRRL